LPDFAKPDGNRYYCEQCTKLDNVFVLPMLSILIPVYNYNVSLLVNELHHQGAEAGIEFEIILGDDCSSVEIQSENMRCESLSGVRILKSKMNRGRAGTRNRLAENARFPWLLFLDADAGIYKTDFLKKYIHHCDETCKVVVGGIAYQNCPPDNKELYLRWLYGKKREEKNVCARIKNPYYSFSSFNFLISAKVLKSVRFNEEIRSYGHEDTLFGLELRTSGIEILHIDNQALHNGLESAEAFLFKTKEGVRNVLGIYLRKNSEISKSVKLLRYYCFFRFFGFSPLFSFLFKKWGPLIEKKLIHSHPSLYLLDIYKLMYIFSL
jgi:glycosyltransferase involved in cell wall biosynthesis